jgi:hypothetical protein
MNKAIAVGAGIIVGGFLGSILGKFALYAIKEHAKKGVLKEISKETGISYAEIKKAFVDFEKNEKEKVSFDTPNQMGKALDSFYEFLRKTGIIKGKRLECYMI